MAEAPALQITQEDYTKLLVQKFPDLARHEAILIDARAVYLELQRLDINVAVLSKPNGFQLRWPTCAPKPHVPGQLDRFFSDKNDPACFAYVGLVLSVRFAKGEDGAAPVCYIPDMKGALSHADYIFRCLVQCFINNPVALRALADVPYDIPSLVEWE